MRARITEDQVSEILAAEGDTTGIIIVKVAPTEN